MIRFLVQKLGRVVLILLAVALLTFLLMHAIPGNPWSNYSPTVRMMYNLDIDPYTQRQLETHFGLDQPLWRQFARYIIGDVEESGVFRCGALCGNLGPSIRQRGRMVQAVFFEPPEGRTFWQSRFGYSIRLVLFGFLIAVGLGIPLGIWSAVTKKIGVSRVISVGLAGLISIPNFVLGLLAIIVAASWLKVIQVIPNWNEPSNWIIPAVVLAAVPMANLARVTQASVKHTLNEDYVRTAHAKGLKQSRVMIGHVLRNALVPILTYMGSTLMEMLIGLFIVEKLYSFPGLGHEYWEAVLELDYPMIMGLTLFYASGMLLIHMVIEIGCAFLDPRIRSAEEGVSA